MSPPRPDYSSPQTESKRKGGSIDLPTFLMHWGLALALLVSLGTGLRIASDHLGSLVGRGARLVLWVLPQGAVIQTHVVAGWTVTLVAITYGAFLWRSRQVARVRIGRPLLQALIRSWIDGPTWSNVPPSIALNRILFQLFFLLIGVLALSGWMLYSGVYLAVSPIAISTLHGVAAWSLVVFVPIHVLIVLKVGTFWKMFRPRPRLLLAGLFGVIVSSAAAGLAYMQAEVLYPDLIVPHVSAAPLLDGVADDPAWEQAQLVEVITTRGANLPGGESRVQVRAVHDGRRIYFLFQWTDPQRSQKMTPLLKTEDGWTVLQTGLERNDENHFYEDKFAAAFSYRPAIGSGTVHLGQSLIDGPHYPNPRGLHFTVDGSIVDLWHWKSVRSGGMNPGHVDDNHFGPPLPPIAAGARYTGGYTQDPPASPHPYIQNWSKVDPELPLSETAVVPLHLPRHPEILTRMGEIDLDPTAHDEGIWHMDLEDTVPYSPELDVYPPGTVLPGIVLVGRFQGDRADVLAEALWQDGFWTLETSRALDTGSEFDMAFQVGRDVFLWVSVFNHTQTRHSQHLHPIRVILK